MTKTKTLCFIGHLVGRNLGYVTTQDLILADLFARTNYQVISASSSTNRFIRFLNIVVTIVRYRHSVDVVHLSIYSGRSFIIEDAASFLCRIFQIPLVMTLHGGDLPNFMARFPRWSKRVLQR